MPAVHFLILSSDALCTVAHLLLALWFISGAAALTLEKYRHKRKKVWRNDKNLLHFYYYYGIVSFT